MKCGLLRPGTLFALGSLDRTGWARKVETTEDSMAVYIIGAAARVQWRGEYAAALAWVSRRGLGERVERVGGVS